jgi:hypothetical protein
MKFCIDCKHYKFIESGKWRNEKYQCAHPTLLDTDLVTGEITISSVPCDQMRKVLCDTHGALWEPKIDASY